MKLPPANIPASARGMIKNFGNNAATEARATADRCAKRRDFEGRETWLSIAAAIDLMQVPVQANTLMADRHVAANSEIGP